MSVQDCDEITVLIAGYYMDADEKNQVHLK